MKELLGDVDIKGTIEDSRLYDVTNVHRLGNYHAMHANGLCRQADPQLLFGIKKGMVEMGV